MSRAIGDLRRRLGRPRHRAPASPSSATTSSIRDVVPEKIEALRARRGAVPRAGARRAARAQPRAADASRSTSSEALDGAEFLFVCVGTPPTYSGDADLSRGLDGVDELPELDERGDPRDEEHRAGRHRREGARTRSTRAASRTSATSRTPSSSPRARAVRDFMRARPHRRRRVRATADGDAVAALYERLDAPVVRTDVALGRDDQARRERVPDDADQLHQRDRERLRG